MAFHATSFPSRSRQATMVWNTSPLIKRSPVSHTGQPLRAFLQQSIHSCCRNTSQSRPVPRNDNEHPRRVADGQRQSALLGLGLTLPLSVSLRASDCPIYSNDNNILLGDAFDQTFGLEANTSSFTESPQILNEMALTPVLHPLDFQDEISPILPLPSPVDAVHRTTETVSASTNFAELISQALPICKDPRPSNRRLSTSDHVRIQVCTSDPMTTEDITSEFLGEEIRVAEPTNLLYSLDNMTPTIDIADEGVLLIHEALGSSITQFGSNGRVFSHDDGIVENPVKDGKYSSLTLCNVTPTTHLSPIPLYHGEAQTHALALCPSPDPADLRRARTGVHFRSNFVMRDPAMRAQKNGPSKKPIEVPSPSMTPSPTNSPKFCIPPVQLKEDSRSRVEILARRLPWTQSLSTLKTGRCRSSIVCMKGRSSRSSRHEVAIISKRQGAWSSPHLRSPIVPSHSGGASSPDTGTRGDVGDTAATRALSSQLVLSLPNVNVMLEEA